MPQHLLVVEDDDLQRSVLKSALEKSGYQVDSACDGVTAVRMLRDGCYDLAIFDYHLPEIDGLASARLVQELMGDEARPKLIALTADIERLNSQPQARGVFDEVLPKRRDLAVLVGIIESHLRERGPDRAAQAAAATWQRLGLMHTPAVLVMPPPTALQVQFLRGCFDISGRREPELVLLTGPESMAAATAMRSSGASFALPFVDLDGGSGQSVDASFSVTDLSTWAGVADTIIQFAERRLRLRPEILIAGDVETRLLVYSFLSNQSLRPSTDPTSRRTVRYPGLFAEEEAWRAIERLAARGLLDRHFIDRIYCCPGCTSGRLTIRAECRACRSAHLQPVALVHHLRCGHRAPEDAFSHGFNLTCPKCHQVLVKAGTDYDRSGHTLTCADCGAINGDPATGFSCMDCGAHADVTTAAKRDIFSYVINSEGVMWLTSKTARVAASPIFTIGEVPFAVRDALQRPEPILYFAQIGYCPAQRIIARRGGAALRSMRRLFLENLMVAIDGTCEAFMDDEKDYLLVRRSSLPLPLGLTREVLDGCQELLTEPMYPDVRQFDPLSFAEVR